MAFGCYGPLVTWKVVYYPKVRHGDAMGVAFVEADCHQMAMYTFARQYAGQYTTIYKCEKLIK